MGITKRAISLIVVLACTLIAYNVIVFMAPFSRHDLFWISYAFTTVGVLIAVSANLYVYSRPMALKSKFYRIPFTYVTTVYLVAVLIAGFVFMANPLISVWIAWVVELVLLVLCLLGLVGSSVATDHEEQVDANTWVRTSGMKAMQAQAESLGSMTSDPNLRGAIVRLADNIRYSDPMSNESLSAIEYRLSDAINQLQGAIMSGDVAGGMNLCAQAQALLDERNRECKAFK